MKKISIEYAHVYTNQDFNLECTLFKKYIDEMLKTVDRKNVSLVVMVDDYSFPDPTFDYNRFLSHVETSTHYHIDSLIRESQLIKYCDVVLNEIIDTSFKEELVDWITLHKKYPCSLFVATWYLIRLGNLESEILTQEYIAEKLVNILPRSFEKFENKGFEIISKTPWKNVLDSIENIYIPGRDV